MKSNWNQEIINFLYYYAEWKSQFRNTCNHQNHKNTMIYRGTQLGKNPPLLCIDSDENRNKYNVFLQLWSTPCTTILFSCWLTFSGQHLANSRLNQPPISLHNLGGIRPPKNRRNSLFPCAIAWGIGHLLSAKALHTQQYTNLNFCPPQLGNSNSMHVCVYF